MLRCCDGNSERNDSMSNEKNTLNDIKSGKGLPPINTSTNGSSSNGFTTENRGQNSNGICTEIFSLNKNNKMEGG